MRRSQILDLAATLQVARILLLDTDPGLKPASDRLVDVLAALHKALRWTPAELDRLGEVQMSLVARFWREGAIRGR